MFSRIARIALLGAMFAGAIAIPQQAEATSFADLTVEQYVDASTYIVRGTVQDQWTEINDRGIVWTRTRVKLSDWWKGSDKPQEIIVDQMGGQYGDVVTHIEGQAIFSEGERVFLFLHQTKEGLLVPVAKYRGKLTIRRAPGERRRYVARWITPSYDKFDHRFMPHPPIEKREYLDSLVQQVEDRLSVGWDGKEIPGLSLDNLQRINTLERRTIR